MGPFFRCVCYVFRRAHWAIIIIALNVFDVGTHAPVGKKPEIPIHEYALRDPVYFGDYRSAALTGQDRYYEDLIDYEACFALLQEVSLCV